MIAVVNPDIGDEEGFFLDGQDASRWYGARRPAPRSIAPDLSGGLVLETGVEAARLPSWA